jgi:exopolyphosphatase / guanosine-5'-triphosphate,3'-diphosphate pyrophosphatase
VAAQLGREPGIPFEVVARCGPGHPLVIRNRPIDASGNPFPTLYWLTCPDTVKAVSRLEADGWIRKLNEQAEIDPDLRTALRRAHEEYARERESVLAGSGSWGGVGGTGRGVKCLHAHYAYHLAGGEDPVGQWVAKQLARAEPIHYEKPGRRLAAIDLGTNSVRLLVARTFDSGEPLVDVARDMLITRLGQGVDRTNRIAPDALRRTVRVIERFARRARALGAERVRLSATSAVRDATNRDELADAVQRLTGEPMEVLSGRHEAERSFVGAVRSVSVPGPRLVVDIGGGSTEFALGGDAATNVVSAQIGSVRLTERYVHTDPPSFEELDRVDLAVTSVLHQVEDRIPVHDAASLVLVAGTATTVQAISLGLLEYDPEAVHGSTLTRADAERVFRLLADMTTEERRDIAVMPPGREDVIPAGATILVAVMRRWGFAQAVVSESDILDGLVYDMVDAPTSR